MQGGGAAENAAQVPDLSECIGLGFPIDNFQLGSILSPSNIICSYSLDPFPSDVVVAVADLALEAGELAVLVARLALQALRLHHLI